MSNKPVKTMTRAERLAIRVAKRDAEIALARSMGIDPRSKRTANKNHRWVVEHSVNPEQTPKTDVDTRPLFDASSWRPTAKVLELLGESKKPTATDREAIADANEEKYGGEHGITYADRMIEKTSTATSKRYDEIESLVGTNGDCHSRQTTYRRWKFGRGNLSKGGWEAQGFSENKKC